jgi:Spy/CpxP family protein refolding chaperone
MKYELQQIKSRRTKTLKDRNLTQEERDKIRKKYNDLIKQRIDQLREYREESTIPKELR